MMLYWNTYISGKTDIPYGFNPVQLLSASAVMTGKVVKSQEEINKIQRTNAIQVLDVEHLRTKIDYVVFQNDHELRKKYWHEIEESMDILIEVIDKAVKAAPHLVHGFYGLMPPREYWDSISKNPGVHTNWAMNAGRFKYSVDDVSKLFISRGLADCVDRLFPSLYTFYALDDERYQNPAAREQSKRDWALYSINNLKLARTYNKLTYPYVWYRYHGGGGGSRAWQGQLIPLPAWRWQLETIKPYCDGIVMWGFEPAIQYWGDSDPNTPATPIVTWADIEPYANVAREVFS